MTVVAVPNVVALKVAVVDVVICRQAPKLFWAFPCFLISSISVQMYQAHTSVGPIGSHYKIQGISIGNDPRGLNRTFVLCLFLLLFRAQSFPLVQEASQ